jgi:hypothetical protein
MPQTLLALFALVLASLLTFNQQRLTLRSHENLVADEVELAAAGVASEVLAFVDGRSFDEESTPSAIADENGVVPDDPDEFTAGATFGATDRGSDGCNLLKPVLTPDCDDVDDVAWDPDDMEDDGWRDVTVELSHGRELPFEVRMQVYYVDDPESMVESASPTRHKRILIDIRSPFAGDANGVYRATRVVSYDPIKAEMDWENSSYYDPTYGSGDDGGGGGGTHNQTPGQGGASGQGQS